MVGPNLEFLPQLLVASKWTVSPEISMTQAFAFVAVSKDLVLPQTLCWQQIVCGIQWVPNFPNCHHLQGPVIQCSRFFGPLAAKVMIWPDCYPGSRIPPIFRHFIGCCHHLSAAPTFHLVYKSPVFPTPFLFQTFFPPNMSDLGRLLKRD